jgi:fructosamine-3-kinase
VTSRLYTDIETALGARPVSAQALSGGCVGEVYKVKLADGDVIVAKVGGSPAARLALEGWMLRYLTEHSRLPVPAVLYSSDSLLLMEFVEGDSHFTKAAQQHAAELLADLHNIRAPQFGLESDTLIGGLHQPNPWTSSWLDFFRDQRLLYMANEAVREGRLPQKMLGRIEKFAARLDQWLEEPGHPALIHGDVWTTNVLATNGRITGFIDPAIYYADPEIELAFTTLFGTFGEPFFQHYSEIRPLRPGFMEERRDIYNLYPLLVHVRLFGGSYVQSVDGVLRRFGC